MRKDCERRSAGWWAMVWAISWARTAARPDSVVQMGRMPGLEGGGVNGCLAGGLRGKGTCGRTAEDEDFAPVDRVLLALLVF